MTTDEMQLLRDFRREVPEPNEETMRRAYAYATSEAPSGWQQSLRLSVSARSAFALRCLLRLRSVLPRLAPSS
jgi:hypothetical protein